MTEVSYCKYCKYCKLPLIQEHEKISSCHSACQTETLHFNDQLSILSQAHDFLLGLRAGQRIYGKYFNDLQKLYELTKIRFRYEVSLIIPEEFFVLHNLTFITFQECSFDSSFDFSVLAHLQNLTKISFFKCPIDSIPSGLFSLVKLEYLRFWECPIKSLPSDIERLVNLNSLSIMDSLITDIPATIGRLEKLSELDLSYNKFLSSLPNELASLKLNTIRIQDTSISSLPEWFFSFDLKVLDISGLKITNIGNILEYILNYPNLEDLRAIDCNIKSVPIDFFIKLTKLEIVDLSYNHISEFPELDDDFAIETDPQIINGEEIYFYED